MEFFAEGFGEGGARFDVDLASLSIDVEGDWSAFLGQHALVGGGLGGESVALGASDEVGGENAEAGCFEEVAAGEGRIVGFLDRFGGGGLVGRCDSEGR